MRTSSGLTFKPVDFKRIFSLGLAFFSACAPQLIGSGQFGIAGLSISVSFGAVPGGYYSDSDTAPRTITFSHNGTSALCSHDGGATYGSCDSANTLVFTVADYTGSKVLKIKVSKTGYANAIYTITLPTDIAGLTFSTCQSTVSANEDFTTFKARINAVGKVVCINSGVTVTNSGAETNIIIGTGGQNFNNVKIIGLGTGASRGGFSSGATGAGSSGIIIDNDATGTVLSNLLFSKTADAPSEPAIGIEGAGTMIVRGVSCTASNTNTAATWGTCLGTVNFGGTSLNVAYSDFTMSGTNSDGVVVQGTGVVMDHVTITKTGTGSGKALYVNDILTITNSTITSTNCNGGSAGALMLGVGGSLGTSGSPATNLSITSSGTTCHAIYNGQGELFLNSSTVTSTGMNAGNSAIHFDTITSATTQTISNSIIITNRNGISLVTNGVIRHLQLDNVTFKHTASGGDGYAMVLGGGAPFYAVDSVSNGNAFCNMGTATPWFTGTAGAPEYGGIFGGNTPDASGNFVVASQYNSGVIYNCP